MPKTVTWFVDGIHQSATFNEPDEINTEGNEKIADYYDRLGFKELMTRIPIGPEKIDFYRAETPVKWHKAMASLANEPGPSRTFEYVADMELCADNFQEIFFENWQQMMLWVKTWLPTIQRFCQAWPKFIQIVNGHEGMELYTLDENGEVWERESGQSYWARIPNSRVECVPEETE